jgi:mono/diheme cytochrome c family protein
MRKSGSLALFTVLSLFVTAAVAEEGDGERMFKNKCASCHGKDGSGKTKKGEQMGIADISTAAWQKEFTDAKIKETMVKGLQREKDGKKQKMDPLGKDLSDDELAAIIKVVRSLKK